VSAAGTIEGEVSARGRRVAIVAARFNDFIVASLLKGARAAWVERGGAAEDLMVVRVPGAFELPVAVRRLAASGRYDAVVALGCVVKRRAGCNSRGSRPGCRWRSVCSR